MRVFFLCDRACVNVCVCVCEREKERDVAQDADQQIKDADCELNYTNDIMTENTILKILKLKYSLCEVSFFFSNISTLKKGSSQNDNC